MSGNINYTAIKKILQEMRCSIHHEGPREIRELDHGLKIKACCDKFQDELEDRRDEEVIKQKTI